jgi:hypothetical protein
METLRVLPMVLIPLFGVPVTGALHLMTLHRLFTRRGEQATYRRGLREVSSSRSSRMCES